MSSDASIAYDALQRGRELHATGQRAQALVLFQQALALQPDNLDAANACATLLVELGKTKEAFHLLDFRRKAVLQHADSACNWAIVCEQLGQTELAAQAYEAALQLQPDHLRTLNNSALMAASRQDWGTAVSRLTHAHQLQPDELGIVINLCDVQTAALQTHAAMGLISAACHRHPQRPDIEIRHATLLAFSNRLEESRAAFASLSAPAGELLVPYLESIGINATRFGWNTRRLPPVADLYLLHGFHAMQACHWQGNAELTQTAGQLIDAAHAHQQAHDWRDLAFYALMLPLREAQQGQAMQACRRYYINRVGVAQNVKWREHPDGRLHIAIATANLHEERPRQQLRAWLKRIDTTRCAIHLFSNTPNPSSGLRSEFSSLCHRFHSVAHVSATELVATIRSSDVQIFLDTAFYTPWCRVELPYFGVAPIQLRHQAWHRLNPGTVQFAIGDAFTHSQGDFSSADYHGSKHGPTIRLPHSCWLAADDTLADEKTPSRDELGLPENAFVLCSRLGTPMINPATFALWMQIMQALPLAVLWLPNYEHAAQVNLRREAQGAGISASRLIFAKSASRPQQLAQLRQADLFLDALLFNANHGLVDALRMGVPALSCAGNNMASRLGGSIIRAAGLPEMVFDSEVLGVEAAKNQYLERAIALGQNPSELQQIKTRLKTLQTTAPLFQIDQRVAEWQTAWEMMAAQARQGLPFTAFDVPDASR